MNSYVVHYGEIGLKGRNRPDFEHQLMRNIRAQHDVEDVRRLPGRIVVKAEGDLDLGGVIGIAWWAKARQEPPEIDAISRAAVEMASRRGDGVQSFAIRAKLAEDGFPLSLYELESEVGRQVQEAYELAVDLSHPDLTIYIEVMRRVAFLYTEKNPGPRGLPVGISGRLVGLFSGGIDSAVAAYLMAKRGAELDLLHFYAVQDAAAAHRENPGQLAGVLSKYVPEVRIHYVPYHRFQIATSGLRARVRKYELVAFRRFMARTAERLARMVGAQGLFSGDNLGQVASQTLENLAAVDQTIGLPIFRPLIAYEKQEIIDFGQQLGFFEIAKQPYKDCCSIIVRQPATRANLERIATLEAEVGVDNLVEQAIQELAAFRLSRGSTVRVPAGESG